MGREHPETVGLWRHHQNRLAAGLARLRVGWPQSVLPRRDPRAMRLAVGLLLIIGLFSGGGDIGARLLHALEPNFATAGDGLPITAEIQVTPPEYTNIAPIFVDGASVGSGAVGVPSGSRILAQVHNGHVQPTLRLGGDEKALQAFAEQTWRAETTVEATETTPLEIQVRVNDNSLLRVPIVVVPDTTPVVTFATPPAATRRAALRLHP